MMTLNWRIFLIWLTACAFALESAYSEEPPGDNLEIKSFANPIIPGFAADPSIVRVGDDFYLVTSSFEYFPGLPIYHSTDLVNWELIGHALADSDVLNLSALDSSGGVHAATIRHHDGVFYVVSTNIDDEKPESFVVTAQDPRGPWSDAVIVEDAVGIDPSLFFDDDGRAWYTANWTSPNPEFPGQAEIWVQEFDLDTFQLIGERRFLWSGCCRGVWAEGPHIYKRAGKYYLMLSEGGTSYEHAVSIAVSDKVTGPYEGNPAQSDPDPSSFEFRSFDHGRGPRRSCRAGGWTLVRRRARLEIARRRARRIGP